jgi:DNA-binding NarL/FixJ family response regulator
VSVREERQEHLTMETSVDQPRPTNEAKQLQHRFALICPMPELTLAIREGLQQHELRFDQSAPVAVILDAPTGFALSALKQWHAGGRRLVVMTWSSCPEYWDDLWDFGIDGFIAGSCSTATLACVIFQAAQGQSVRLPPRSMTPLTAVERRILNLLARGNANQEIAVHLALSHQTVRNSLTTIYEKLHVKSRCEAMLYYWGMRGISEEQYELAHPSYPQAMRAR